MIIIVIMQMQRLWLHVDIIMQAVAASFYAY